MSNFDPNAVLRGAQLTLVGAYRALQNPLLFRSAHYNQVLKAVLIGVLIRLIVSTPIFFLRLFLSFLSIFIDLQSATWDDRLLGSLTFLEHSVLQLPLFLMGLMRYIVPTLDDMFMLSLEWVDGTYLAKHLPIPPPQGDDRGQPETHPAIPAYIQSRLYYPTLSLYPPHNKPPVLPHTSTKSALKPKALKRNSPLKSFLLRSLRKAAVSLLIYVLTFVPYVGHLVLPISTIYSLHRFAGPLPSAVFALAALFVLPKSTTVRLLQMYFASRSLVRDLLEPYFTRLPFTKEQKARWFRDREGLLFGFGVGWVLLIKIPLVGVLVYGIAEASTAYLITKITEPVPPPPTSSEAKSGPGSWFKGNEKGGRVLGSEGKDEDVLVRERQRALEEWCESETRWKNKKEFLNLPVEWLMRVSNGGFEGGGFEGGGVGMAEGEFRVPGGYVHVGSGESGLKEGGFTGGRM